MRRSTISSTNARIGVEGAFIISNDVRDSDKYVTMRVKGNAENDARRTIGGVFGAIYPTNELYSRDSRKMVEECTGIVMNVNYSSDELNRVTYAIESRDYTGLDSRCMSLLEELRGKRVRDGGTYADMRIERRDEFTDKTQNYARKLGYIPSIIRESNIDNSYVAEAKRDKTIYVDVEKYWYVIVDGYIEKRPIGDPIAKPADIYFNRYDNGHVIKLNKAKGGKFTGSNLYDIKKDKCIRDFGKWLGAMISDHDNLSMDTISPFTDKPNNADRYVYTSNTLLFMRKDAALSIMYNPNNNKLYLDNIKICKTIWKKYAMDHITSNFTYDNIDQLIYSNMYQDLLERKITLNKSHPIDQGSFYPAYIDFDEISKHITNEGGKKTLAKLRRTNDTKGDIYYVIKAPPKMRTLTDNLLIYNLTNNTEFNISIPITYKSDYIDSNPSQLFSPVSSSAKVPDEDDILAQVNAFWIYVQNFLDDIIPLSGLREYLRKNDELMEDLNNINRDIAEASDATSIIKEKRKYIQRINTMRKIIAEERQIVEKERQREEARKTKISIGKIKANPVDENVTSDQLLKYVHKRREELKKDLEDIVTKSEDPFGALEHKPDKNIEEELVFLDMHEFTEKEIAEHELTNREEEISGNEYIKNLRKVKAKIEKSLESLEYPKYTIDILPMFHVPKESIFECIEDICREHNSILLMVLWNGYYHPKSWDVEHLNKYKKTTPKVYDIVRKVRDILRKVDSEEIYKSTLESFLQERNN